MLTAALFMIKEVNNKTTDSGYNKIYMHQWRTTSYGLPMHWIERIDCISEGKWGWHFIPNKNMDYQRDDWYENQTLYLTFENQEDLIQVRLSLGN